MEDSIVESIYFNRVDELLSYLKSNKSVSNESMFSFANLQKQFNILSVLPMNNLKLTHIAAIADSLDCFIVLENFGFSINDQSAAMYLPIHYACLFRSYEIVSYILSKDPSMAKVEPPVEYHLLYLTATGGDDWIMRLLFANNVNFRSPANRKNNPFQKAVQSAHFECLKVLLENGEKPMIQDYYTPSMQAAINRQPEAVEYLVKTYHDPINYVSPVEHRTLLGLCCFIGDIFKPTIIKILRMVDNIEPPSTICCKGPVHWLCELLDLDVAREFLQHEILVNRIDNEGKTGFHYLIDKPPKLTKTIIKIMKLLINYGFDVNVQCIRNNSKTSTVLETFCTCIKKSYDIIEFLIKHGANIYAETTKNSTLYDLVMKKNDAKLKTIFLNAAEQQKPNV